MDVREKLVVLLSEKCMETCKQRKGYVCSVEECKRSKEKCCGFYADHLIANGVTVQENTAADVAPVRHGRWKCNQPCPVCGGDRFEGLGADIWADWEPPYCPNCGAKMDGGAE